MDFLHPDKKRKRLIKLILGYFLMGIALGFATLIVVFINLGYDIDRSTGDIIQKGLLIVDAHPESAEIFINGASSGQTDKRFELSEGSYSVELKRDGYLPWAHDLNLEGGSIEQLAYPFLFPEKLVTKPIASFSSAPPMFSQSPDRKWLVIALPDKPGEFNLIDLVNSKNPQTTLKLPADTFTPSSTHKFEEVEWASDNESLLLKHTFSTGSEFIMLNRTDPLESVNISKLFPGQPATEITLRDKKANQFYFYNQSTATVATANSSDLSVIALLKNVIEFKPYKNDIIAYIGSSASGNTAELHLWKGGKDSHIKNLPIGENYLVDIAEFNNKLYLAGGSSGDGRVYIYSNPFNLLSQVPTRAPKAFRVLIVKDAKYVSFSAVSRFIAVQNGSNFVVFDAENARQFRYTLDINIDPSQKAKWMDGHRLSLVSQDKSIVFDFDKTNFRTLSPASLPYLPVFNKDYNAMFSLTTGDKGSFSLIRTELLVPPIDER